MKTERRKYVCPNSCCHGIDTHLMATISVGIDPGFDGDWIYDWETGEWVWRPRRKGINALDDEYDDLEEEESIWKNRVPGDSLFRRK